jgi:hypothetical protein
MLPVQSATRGSKSFLDKVDTAVEEALPDGWPRMPRERFPWQSAVEVRHAFRLSRRNGPSEELALVAVPDLGETAFSAAVARVEADLRLLVDDVIDRGALLLLLYEHESRDSCNFLAQGIHERVSWPDPRLLAVGCAQDANGTLIVAPNWERSEPLSETIRGLWSGELWYAGPEVGLQTVGVETMGRDCWSCERLLETVTGLMVPEGEVDWTRTDLAYSQYLLPLDEVPKPDVLALTQAVDRWRASGESLLSPIRYRFSNTLRASYWAATCPWCGALQGAFPVKEDRCHLFSSGLKELRYRELELDLSANLLRALAACIEIGPALRTVGWFRDDTRDLFVLPELSHIDR